MSASVEQWRAAIDRERGELSAPYLLGLLEAVSGGNPTLVNEYGAIGLYQIHPDTAATLEVSAEQLADPAVNIRTAIRLLRARSAQLLAADPSLEQRPEDLAELTLAAYWYGPAEIVNALRAGARTSAEVWAAAPSGERMARFVAAVLELAESYGSASSGAPAVADRPFPWKMLAGLGLLAAGVVWAARK